MAKSQSRELRSNPGSVQSSYDGVWESRKSWRGTLNDRKLQVVAVLFALSDEWIVTCHPLEHSTSGCDEKKITLHYVFNMNDSCFKQTISLC